MFAGSERIGVAVSGGADSVALLHALGELYPGRSLAAVHLNHSLRAEESDADEAFVRALAARLGCGLLVRREDVAAQARRAGRNLEQAGRVSRYRYFGELLSDGSCDVIATAHTRSDQAETVLFRLLRGSAGNGLSGIWPSRAPGIVRPMLDVSREEVVAYLRRSHLLWREDSSNADERYSRNRLRHSLLPLLRREWNPGVEKILANTADWALEEERCWQGRVIELRRRCVRESPAGLILDVAAARALHIAEFRRLVDDLLQSPRFRPGRAGFEHIESVRLLVFSPSGSGTVELPGARAERSFGEVLLAPLPGPEEAPYDLPLAVPGLTFLPGDSGKGVKTRLLGAADTPKLYNKDQPALLDWDLVPRHLRLRNWRAGDRYQPVGQQSPRKITELFGRYRVSAWRRAGWPVVTASNDAAKSGRIVWTRGFGPAGDLAAGPRSRRVLALDESGGDSSR